jgi:hypothetical protein
MSHTNESLPEELLWTEEGHASDVVLCALGDGQTSIVPSSVAMHVEHCPTCVQQLGHAALLSLHAGRQFAVVTRDALAHKPARESFPHFAVGTGLVMAVLGLVPSLVDAPSHLQHAKALAVHNAPIFMSGLGAVARSLSAHGTPISPLVSSMAVVLIALVAFTLMRVLPKKETL